MTTMTVRAARLVARGDPLRVEEVPLAGRLPAEALRSAKAAAATAPEGGTPEGGAPEGGTPEGGTPEGGTPGDEVVVEMSYAGVNPIDRYIVLGRVAPDAPLPRTVGVEGVGTVDGRLVVVHGTGVATSREGLWATAARVPLEATVGVPDGVDPQSAAAVGVAGATAWRTVHDLAQVRSDDRVLVMGASGGVGSMIVSLLRSSGALVWGQTGQERKRDAIMASGAARAVVVGTPAGLGDAVRELRPTVIFDPLGGGFTGAAVDALETRGRLAIFGASADTHGSVPLQSLYRKGLRVLGYGARSEPAESVHQAIRHALEAVRDGQLNVAVDEVMPLDAVNDAMARLARRDVEGKLLLCLSR